MKDFFKEIFQEDNGGFSAVRALMIVWFLGQLIVWIGLCVYTKSMVDLPTNIIASDMAWMAAKVWQKKEEAKSN